MKMDQDLKFSWHHALLTLTNRPFWIVLVSIVGVQYAGLLHDRQRARVVVWLAMVCPESF